MADITIRQSELRAWQECRRHTDWSYWQQLQRISHVPNKADQGTLMHRVLEAYYGSGQHAESGHAALREFEESLSPLERVAHAENINLTRIMFRGYLDWLAETGEDAGLVVTGVERRITVPWPNRVLGVEVEVTGKVDLEGIDALGRPILIDHKDVDRIEPMRAPSDFQRLTYAVLRRLEDGTEYKAAIHNQLRRVKRTSQAKPPFYGRQEITFNAHQIENHFSHMDGIISEIVTTKLRAEQPGFTESQAHRFLPPNPTRDCSWKCPFFQACQLRDDGSNWEGYLSEWFRKTEEDE